MDSTQGPLMQALCCSAGGQHSLHRVLHMHELMPVGVAIASAVNCRLSH